MNKRSLAGLLHCFGWKLAASEVSLAPNISLGRFDRSPIGKLYEELSTNRGLDDGGFDFDAYLALDAVDYGGPYELLDRVCNVIAIVTSHPISMSRLLISSDGFRTCADTHMIYTQGEQTEFLMKKDATLTEKNVAEIYKAWQVASAVWEEGKAKGRVPNALTYFYYAWRSQYVEQMCLNLAIVLEVLFSTESQGDGSHQTSFSVAHFLTSSPERRRSYYDLLTRFFGLRSRIVRGAMPDDYELIDVTVEVFHLCSLILKRTLLSAELAEAFTHNNLRTNTLMKCMFGDVVTCLGRNDIA